MLLPLFACLAGSTDVWRPYDEEELVGGPVVGSAVGMVEYDVPGEKENKYHISLQNNKAITQQTQQKHKGRRR